VRTGASESDRGGATVEQVGLVLLVAAVMGGLIAAVAASTLVLLVVAHTLPLAALLGLEDLADGIAAAAAPRVPAALQASALGGVLAGELTVAQAAARSGRSEAAMRRALTGLGLDRLLPIV
jgi:hypothetical protein